MRMYDIIKKKRDGYELAYTETEFFINGYCNGSIPDYQAAALLMAIFLKGMNESETAALTEIMANSGDKLDLSDISGFKADKHSTGGVGDKTSLIVGPVVAACGIPFAKMSGRGLGHTGGTVDKLESIPGFNTSLSKSEFIANVREIGLAITGQSGNLAPADKKLYALRDVTATVDNISLIASSIMSKKIASGADCIVLDVKTGSGAFMKTTEQAVQLAKLMVETGKRVGRKTSAIITDMDTPLGYAVGNSLEVIEAIETLKGNGPEDLENVSVELSARILELAAAGNIEYCRQQARNAIYSGSALHKLSEMIHRQNGNKCVVNDYSLLGKAGIVHEVVSDRDGYISSVKTDAIGTAAMVLGAGRATKESSIDHTAGIILNKKTGMRTAKGEVLAYLHTNIAGSIDEASRILLESINISKTPTSPCPLIISSVV